MPYCVDASKGLAAAILFILWHNCIAAVYHGECVLIIIMQLCIHFSIKATMLLYN